MTDSRDELFNALKNAVAELVIQVLTPISAGYLMTVITKNFKAKAEVIEKRMNDEIFELKIKNKKLEGLVKN